MPNRRDISHVGQSQIKPQGSVCWRHTLDYNRDMILRTVGVATFLIASLSFCAVSSPASLGSTFSGTYTSFAPLYALYKTYADYLFSGTPIVIPDGLEQACTLFQMKLETLQMALIVQTDSERVAQVTRVAHLRQTMASFCDTYQGTIAEIASLSAPDMGILQDAADSGLFAAISGANKELEAVFTSTIDGYATKERWAFDVAFSMRTLLSRGDFAKLDRSLSQILLGPDGAQYGPGVIPLGIVSQVNAVASLAGRDLDEAEQQKAAAVTQEIYDYLMN